MKKILIMLLICNPPSANAQIKTDTMIEKFKYTTTKEGTIEIVLQENGWVIEKWTNAMFQREFAPARDFYMILKKYHENGMIESRGKLLGEVPFGIWEYFDENGHLIKTVDEDKKFGKIKPNALVDIIEKVGWINRKTGENIIVKSPLKTDGTFYSEIIHKMNISFSPAQYSKNGEEIGPPIWSFGYPYLSKIISYSVNGNTGAYERHETQYLIEE